VTRYFSGEGEHLQFEFEHLTVAFTYKDRLISMQVLEMDERFRYVERVGDCPSFRSKVRPGWEVASNFHPELDSLGKVLFLCGSTREADLDPSESLTEFSLEEANGLVATLDAVLEEWDRDYPAWKGEPPKSNSWKEFLESLKEENVG
jgi:hypothetical protein